MSDRYRDQNSFVRCWRRCRWKSLYAAFAAYVIASWLIRGGKIARWEQRWFHSRRQYVRHLWTLAMSLASCKMGDVYTFDEVIEELDNDDHHHLHPHFEHYE